MNSIIITGNLTKKPELRQVDVRGDKVSVLDMSVAVSNGKDSDGNQRESFFFIVQCWRGLAEACANALDKGNKVAVNGKLVQSRYNKDDKQEIVVKIEADIVEFLTPKDKE